MVLKINQNRCFLFRSAAGPGDCNRDAIPNQPVLFLVNLHQESRGKMTLHPILNIIQLFGREPRIQLLERLPKIAEQQNFMVTLAAKGTIFAGFSIL